MKWDETTAGKCRYGDVAETIWGDWNVLWEDSEADYQGHASFLAEHDGKFCFYEWWYGSCSGCDTWEAADFTDEQVAEEMRRTAAWFTDRDHMIRFLDLKEEGAATPISNHGDGGICGNLDQLSGGLLDRLNGMREAIGLPKIDWEARRKESTKGTPR